MLLNLEDLVGRYAMQVTGVIHCGAHLAEEAGEYDRLFPGVPVWWVEANTDVIPKITKALRRYPAQQILTGLLWSEPGVELPFNVTNYDGMSSSILEFGTHPEFSPDTKFVDKRRMTSTTVDELAMMYRIESCNLLNMDLQGVELQCLMGAEDILDGIDYINSEVNTADVYVRCTKLAELDAYLGDRGFVREEIAMVPGQGWGDGFWIRR